jgi:hypothetical protein
MIDRRSLIKQSGAAIRRRNKRTNRGKYPLSAAANARFATDLAINGRITSQ